MDPHRNPQRKRYLGTLLHMYDGGKTPEEVEKEEISKREYARELEAQIERRNRRDMVEKINDNPYVLGDVPKLAGAADARDLDGLNIDSPSASHWMEDNNSTPQRVGNQQQAHNYRSSQEGFNTTPPNNNNTLNAPNNNVPSYNNNSRSFPNPVTVNSQVPITIKLKDPWNKGQGRYEDNHRNSRDFNLRNSRDVDPRISHEFNPRHSQDNSRYIQNNDRHSLDHSRHSLDHSRYSQDFHSGPIRNSYDTPHSEGGFGHEKDNHFSKPYMTPQPSVSSAPSSSVASGARGGFLGALNNMHEGLDPETIRKREQQLQYHRQLAQQVEERKLRELQEKRRLEEIEARERARVEADVNAASSNFAPRVSGGGGEPIRRVDAPIISGGGGEPIRRVDAPIISGGGGEPIRRVDSDHSSPGFGGVNMVKLHEDMNRRQKQKEFQDSLQEQIREKENQRKIDEENRRKEEHEEYLRVQRELEEIKRTEQKEREEQRTVALKMEADAEDARMAKEAKKKAVALAEVGDVEVSIKRKSKRKSNNRKSISSAEEEDDDSGNDKDDYLVQNPRRSNKGNSRRRQNSGNKHGNVDMMHSALENVGILQESFKLQMQEIELRRAKEIELLREKELSVERELNFEREKLRKLEEEKRRELEQEKQHIEDLGKETQRLRDRKVFEKKPDSSFSDSSGMFELREQLQEIKNALGLHATKLEQVKIQNELSLTSQSHSPNTSASMQQPQVPVSSWSNSRQPDKIQARPLMKPQKVKKKQMTNFGMSLRGESAFVFPDGKVIPNPYKSSPSANAVIDDNRGKNYTTGDAQAMQELNEHRLKRLEALNVGNKTEMDAFWKLGNDESPFEKESQQDINAPRIGTQDSLFGESRYYY